MGKHQAILESGQLVGDAAFSVDSACPSPADLGMLRKVQSLLPEGCQLFHGKPTWLQVRHLGDDSLYHLACCLGNCEAMRRVIVDNFAVDPQ